MSNELLPCPFCGGEGRLNHTAIGTQFFPQIVCMKCFLKCEPCQSAAEAIAAWNKRFVCLDKNGDKVFAGDRVRIGPSEDMCGRVDLQGFPMRRKKVDDAFVGRIVGSKGMQYVDQD